MNNFLKKITKIDGVGIKIANINQISMINRGRK